MPRPKRDEWLVVKPFDYSPQASIIKVYRVGDVIVGPTRQLKSHAIVRGAIRPVSQENIPSKKSNSHD